MGSGAFPGIFTPLASACSSDQQQLIQTSVSLLADRMDAACGGQ
jgi:hypothetical protein